MVNLDGTSGWDLRQSTMRNTTAKLSLSSPESYVRLNTM